MKASDLKALFESYKSLKSVRALNGLTLDRIASGSLDADTVLAEYAKAVSESVANRARILEAMAKAPASVSIRIIGPDGTGFDANGPRIRSAILREDSSILKGQIV